jgi:propionyl-CoA carboxylase beta chain
LNLNEIKNPRERLKQSWEAALQGGGEDKIIKQHEKGKMTARERIDAVLDRGSFTELDAFVMHDCHDFGLENQQVVGDGVVTGFGRIEGRLVYLFAQDFTVFGGSLSLRMAQKICKVMDLAKQNGVPLLGINDSGGARIHEGVASLAGYADIFHRNVACSGVVPQISLIMGPCAGGAVYSPAMTDFIFMVDQTSHMFITGPEVIKAVTGEQVSFDELGGAATHTQKSGVVARRFASEAEALKAVQKLLSYLPANNLELPPTLSWSEDQEAKTAANQKELLSLVPEQANKPYEVKTLIEKLLDPDSFFEMSPEYAMNLVVGFARIAGQSVGVVANNPAALAGVLDIDASIKGARFVRFCDAFNIPLITFVDVPGFLPGTAQEHGGIISHGAKLLYAFSEATVPKMTVIIRKAYGGAYCVMNSKHIGADYNAAWPNAEIAVMGPEAACNIIFKRQISEAADSAVLRENLISDYKHKFASPYVAAQNGYIDAVIYPEQTRAALIQALFACRGKRLARPKRKHGNIPL